MNILRSICNRKGRKDIECVCTGSFARASRFLARCVSSASVSATLCAAGKKLSFGVGACGLLSRACAGICLFCACCVK